MKLLTSLSITFAMLASQASADIVTFDFNSGTALSPTSAGLPAGAMMSATGMTDTVILTTTDVSAPEYTDNGTGTFVLTGNTTTGVTTIITGNALGLDNSSLDDAGFLTAGGDPQEDANFNIGESLTLSFNSDVILRVLNFASLENSDAFRVSVAGTTLTGDFGDAPSAGVLGTDDHADPFGETVIAAGTGITFETLGDLQTDIRIAELVVETVAVPEPTSILMLGGVAVVAGIRRRRRS